MLGRRIKLYRLKNGLSRKELATKSGISADQLSKFEDGQQRPDGHVISTLASVLNVNLPQFMFSVPHSRTYQHGEYRKQSSLSKSAQAYICLLVEDYFDRLFLAVDLLGDNVLREPPVIHSLVSSGSPEEDAAALREYLGFAKSGPILSLTDMLENKGILICKICYEQPTFSGINGLADRYPYIAVNSEATPEHQRSTLVHELVHVFFEPPPQKTKEHEKYIEAVSGAFLFSASDAYAELGRKRKAVSPDMAVIAQRYGISIQMLAKRAQQLGIISKEAYRRFQMFISKSAMRFTEGGRITPETPKLLERLVLRACSEERMSMSRAAELLDIPLYVLREKAEVWN